MSDVKKHPWLFLKGRIFYAQDGKMVFDQYVLRALGLGSENKSNSSLNLHSRVSSLFNTEHNEGENAAGRLAE